tara:strand:+ start:1225 stop:2502 length:1278 start_codon:yes stop_codon:yes gene_type:complete
MAYTKNLSQNIPTQTQTGLKRSIQPDMGTGQLRTEFYELEPAEVVSVILDKDHDMFNDYTDIGKIVARPVYSKHNVKVSALIKYTPMDISVVSNYPVAGEYVIVCEYMGKHYYTQKLNVNYTFNNGVSPGKSIDLRNTLTGGAGSKKTDHKKSSSGIATKSSKLYDNIFKESPFIPRLDLSPIEQKIGEVVFNGRYGQSIRFGTNGEKEECYDSPNMIFKVGQRLDDEEWKSEENSLKPIKEDINLDGTSIFLTTKEEIPLIPAPNESEIYYQRLEEDKRPEKFDGKQIVLNSDRIIFNTKRNHFMCFSKLTQYFCTEDKFVVDTLSGINLNTKAQTILSNEDKTIINSPEIYLGVKDEENPSQDEPIVLGETLKVLLEELIDLILKTQFVNGAGPASLNPANIPDYMSIRTKLMNMLSKQNYTI